MLRLLPYSLRLPHRITSLNLHFSWDVSNMSRACLGTSCEVSGEGAHRLAEMERTSRNSPWGHRRNQMGWFTSSLRESESGAANCFVSMFLKWIMLSQLPGAQSDTLNDFTCSANSQKHPQSSVCLTSHSSGLFAQTSTDPFHHFIVHIIS